MKLRKLASIAAGLVLMIAQVGAGDVSVTEPARDGVSVYVLESI